MEVKTERGDFLDKNMKELKGKFISDLIMVWHSNVEFLHGKVSPQVFSDLFMSVFMVFVREILAHMLMNSDSLNNNEIMILTVNKIFDELKEEIINKMTHVREEMKKSH